MLFNTSGPEPTLTISNITCVADPLIPGCSDNSSITAPGYVAETTQGTETGLWNFHSIYLGPSVNVTIIGNRAIVILSRSTAIFDTPLNIAPGTVGVRHSLVVCVYACAYVCVCVRMCMCVVARHVVLLSMTFFLAT